MSGSEEDPLITAEEVATRRFPHPSRDAMDVGAVDVHHILLIATAAVARRLKDQTLAVVAEVRFGVLAAERELPDVPKMPLAGRRHNVGDRSGI